MLDTNAPLEPYVYAILPNHIQADSNNFCETSMDSFDRFHVSREFRRRGIGRRLVETVADYARSRGASALYASCCSAEETIDFYKAMGFILSEHPISSCVEEEPFDIQMERKL